MGQHEDDHPMLLSKATFLGVIYSIVVRFSAILLLWGMERLPLQ